MKVALACGGTGGHVFPGLATAEALVTRGHEVTLWLAGNDVEAKAVEGWQGGVITVPAQGFPSGISFKSVQTAVSLMGARKTCIAHMRQDRPDVLLAMGSYACVGPALAAKRLRIPVVLHEANVIPGKAVKLLSNFARHVAGAFEETRFYLKRKNLELTGMPMRAALEEGLDWTRPEPQASDPLTVLVMGGSRGAHKLNEMASHALVRVANEGQPVEVIHLTGIEDEAEVKAYYEKEALSARVRAFAHDMDEIYKETDLAVCRAGGSTCAELSAFGLPALLVPYPHAAADHQMANARAMEKAGAADVVAESSLSEDWLQEYLLGCMQDPDRLRRLSRASRSRISARGSLALADLVETAVGKTA